MSEEKKPVNVRGKEGMSLMEREIEAKAKRRRENEEDSDETD